MTSQTREQTTTADAAAPQIRDLVLPILINTAKERVTEFRLYRIEVPETGTAVQSSTYVKAQAALRVALMTDLNGMDEEHILIATILALQRLKRCNPHQTELQHSSDQLIAELQSRMP